MVKKILAMMLIAIMLMQTAVFAGMQSKELFDTYLFEDGVDEASGKVYYVAGSNTINKKVKFAMDMGLIDVYAPNNSVTRENIKGALNLLFGGDAIFNKYFKKGDADSALTVDEAIVIFMEAAGYGPYISMSSNGDFTSYLSEAKRRGLLNSFKYEDAKKMFTVEMFYNMFYDALYMPMIGATYSESNSSFSVTEDTLMNTYLKFRLVEGVVTANEYTALKGHSPIEEDSVKISNAVFYNKRGLDDLDAFIGYQVDAFVDKDGNIVSIAVDENENETKAFTDDVAFSPTTTLKSFEYYNDKDRLVKIKLNPLMSVIYNHVAVERIQIKDLDIKNGSIKFIDNDRDKIFDVVFINEYTSFFPQFVYPDRNIVDDFAGNSYDFSGMIEEGLYKGMYDEEGNAITLSSLNVNTPVTLKKAYNSDVVTEMILLKERSYEGVYAQYKAKKDKPYIIGENAYEIAEVYAQEVALKRNVDTTDRDFLPCKTGERVLVYLDHNDKIIKSVQVGNTHMFGYVTQIDDKSGLFNSDIQVNMFTENDRWERRTLAKKVWYNQARYITPAQILNNEAPELYNNSAITQLIKYKLNSKGEICELETADTNNEGLGNYNETTRFQRNFGDVSGSTLRYFQHDLYTLGFKYRTNDGSTKVFVIPDDLSYKDYFRANSNDQNIYFVNAGDYRVQIYDVDKNYVPDVIVQYTGVHGTWVGGASSSGSLILNKGNIYNPSTDDVTPYFEFTTIYGDNSRRMELERVDAEDFITYRGKDDCFGGRYKKVTSYEDIRKGDVLAWAENYFDRVTAVMLSFALDPEMSFEEQAFETDRDGRTIDAENWWGTDLILFAKVLKKDNNAIVVNANKESDFTDSRYNRVIAPGSGQILNIYNVEDETYSKGTFSSIQVGDFVYIELNENIIRNFIIYRP